MRRQLRTFHPTLPQAAGTIVKEGVDAVIYNQLVASDAYAWEMREIYAAELKEAQLRELLVFYRSDLGAPSCNASD